MTFRPTVSPFVYTDSEGSIAGELANNGKVLLVRLGETVLMGFAFDSLQPEVTRPILPEGERRVLPEALEAEELPAGEVVPAEPLPLDDLDG